MRNFLIAVVLGTTGLTFYSAFAHKSKEIQGDITKRVTDELFAANAKDVGIDVDGRHVTLSGIVYDEAQEAAYLKTADDTFGALGPIDGLTYQADGGYVTAQKTDSGITLRGSVPNEAARASLLEAAAAATDGAVDDQLVLSGPEADWQGETQFGMQQLAALSAGAMTASAAGFVLSGTTDGDAEAVAAPVTAREGWSAFVSSPAVETDLSGRVAELNAAVAERDGTIATLTTTQGEITGERDALSAELDALRDGMSDEQATASSLRAELNQATGELGETQTKLTGATATIAALTATVATKEGEITNLSGQVSELETELANRQQALGSTDEQVADLNAQVKKLDAEVYTLNATVSARDTTIKNLNDRLVDTSSNLESDNEKIAALSATLQDRDATLEDRSAEIAALTAARDDKQAQVNTLLGRVGDLETEVATQSAARADKEAQVNTLLGRVGNLETEVAAQSAARADKEAQVNTLLGRVGTLEDTVAARDTSLSDADAKIAALMDTTSSKDANVNALNGQIADLEANVADQDAALNEANIRIATLTTNAQAKDADVGTLSDKVGELTAVVAARDATIAAMRAQPGTSNVAEQCATQASNVMEGSRINFGSGNARINPNSEALLERLTGIALACVGEDLTLEIGGHTDNQGSDADNQRLSERRAQAILAFMTDRGVPTSGVQAIGFGEGTPIADNATAAGRAANRRITFEWQAR